LLSGKIESVVAEPGMPSLASVHVAPWFAER
jgi:hypothetical protein